MNIKQIDRISLQINAVLVLWTICTAYVIVLCFITYNFDYKCTKHLKTAAYTNDPDFAQNQLKQVLDYAIDNNLVEGNSGILTLEPKDDLKNWILKLNNLIVRLKLANAESEEETLTYVKKSLISDENEVIMPENLAFYPYQTWAIIPLLILTTIFCIISATTYVELGIVLSKIIRK